MFDIDGETAKIIAYLLAAAGGIEAIINISSTVWRLIKKIIAPPASKTESNPNINSVKPNSVREVYNLDKYTLSELTWFNFMNFLFPLTCIVYCFLYVDFGKLFIFIVVTHASTFIEFMVLYNVSGMIVLLEGYFEYHKRRILKTFNLVDDDPITGGGDNL